MDKITVKDVKKLLPMSVKIKITGKRTLAVPKRIFKAIKSFYQNTKTKLENYVPEEVKQDVLKQKIDKLEEKRKELDKIKEQMVKQEEFTTGNKKYYLEAIDEEIEKIKNKKITRKSKGLGKFALAKLTLSTYLSRRNEKRMLKKNVKKQIKIENEEAEIMSTLEEITTEKTERQDKIKAILDSNPDLVEYYNSFLEKNEEKKEKTR